MPRIPSLARVLESMPKTEEEAAAPPVCMRTLTRSSGWPTMTQHAPSDQGWRYDNGMNEMQNAMSEKILI